MLDAQNASQENVAAAATPVGAQPNGLYLLFFTELWERFGFYTLQTILILYMTHGLMMQDTKANLLYAAFSSLLYLTPIVGGYLADRYLGFQNAIVIGGSLLVIAYLVCAGSGTTSFFLGLSILVCANGFFKPNVSSIVGELYQEKDTSRDGGFTLFYMGINIGALLPPLFIGTLVTVYGWHTGFLVAAAGMAIGLITFLFGKHRLGNAGLYPRGKNNNAHLSKIFYILFILGLLAAIAICQLAFIYPQTTNIIVELTACGVFTIVLFFLTKEPPAERKKIIAALILIAISVAFWSLYYQTFTSLMLFADRNMERQFLGFPFDAEATQFFNPFFIITLSPILSRFWVKMDARGINPSTQIKFFLGVLFMAAGFIVLALSTTKFSHLGTTSPWWLGLSYFLQTIGELLISPIGLAMITVLIPKRLVGMMMGVWFCAQAASFAIAGYLANFAAVPKHLSATESLPIYAHAFTNYSIIAIAMTILSLLCIPCVNRMLKS